MISILGHFGFKGKHLDGQTVKTRIIADELITQLGSENVACHDTHGGIRFLLRLPFVLLSMLIHSRNIIILPAQNSVLVVPPLLLLFNLLFRRRIHYIVIGGWLPDLTARHRFIAYVLRHLHSIQAETVSMQRRLMEQGFTNVHVMPNVKHLTILSETSLPQFSSHSYPLCTFSRVIREKGIDDAILAVKKCNEQLGYTAFTLDIYGQVENSKEQQEWFANVTETMLDNTCRYKGTIAYDKSVEVLKDYYALLFPTYYEGECFAGTFLDAFSSGLPVIASDWHDNPDIVSDGTTGRIFPVHSVDALADILTEIASKDLSSMRHNCLKTAREYSPEAIINDFIKKFIQ